MFDDFNSDPQDFVNRAALRSVAARMAGMEPDLPVQSNGGTGFSMAGVGPRALHLPGIEIPKQSAVSTQHSANDTSSPASPVMGSPATPFSVASPGQTPDNRVAPFSMGSPGSPVSSREAQPPVSQPGPAATMAGQRLPGLLEEQKRLKDTGSGIHQIKNPILRTLATVGDMAGQTFVPGWRMVPGTQMHHNALVRENLGQINALQGEQLKEAETGQEEAKAQQERAKAAQALEPTGKNEELLYDKNGDPVGFRDATGKIYSQADLEASQDENLQRVGKVLNEAKGKQNKPFLHESEQGIFLIDPNTREAFPVQYNGETLMPKAKQTAAKNASEQLKQRIMQAYEKGDKALVATLQNELKATDPEGAQRIAISLEGMQNTENRANVSRSDRSFQQANGRLNKLKDSVDQLVGRISRLNESLNVATPQADALVGPELLSVMAGGMGSGLRMNEAEIARVVGGRSHWEDLRAAAQKWGPGNSITPDQRQQIRQLVNAVNERLLRKQQLIDKAGEALIDSDDPKEHRRIVEEAEKGFTAVDREAGHTNTVHYVDGKDEYDIPADKEEKFKREHPQAVKHG